MKHQSSARTTAIAVCATIFAFVMTACSTAPKPAETNKVSRSDSSPNSSAAAIATSGDLAGTYTVSGAGADGKTYRGELVVTKRDAVYQMSWRLDAGNYDGIAVQNGNALATAYATGTNGRGCGAIVYKINADNSLDVKWGEWGVNSIGTEKAVPVGDLSGGTGTFTATGTNANGSAYRGKLTVARSSPDVYQFAWETGTNFVGTGVKMGEYLAAGSGAKQCGFVAYEIKGDALEGRWGIPGSTALGTERATKK